MTHQGMTCPGHGQTLREHGTLPDLCLTVLSTLFLVSSVQDAALLTPVHERLSLYSELSVQLVLLLTCPQVRDLCLGIPYDLEAPDGYELDEFLGHKNHPLARMLRDFTDGDNVRSQTLPLRFPLVLGCHDCHWAQDEPERTPTLCHMRGRSHRTVMLMRLCAGMHALEESLPRSTSCFCWLSLINA